MDIYILMLFIPISIISIVIYTYSYWKLKDMTGLEEISRLKEISNYSDFSDCISDSSSDELEDYD